MTPFSALAFPFISRLGGGKLFPLCLLLACSYSLCGEADIDDKANEDRLAWASLVVLAPEPDLPEGVLYVDPLALPAEEWV